MDQSASRDKTAPASTRGTAEMCQEGQGTGPMPRGKDTEFGRGRNPAEQRPQEARLSAAVGAAVLESLPHVQILDRTTEMWEQW